MELKKVDINRIRALMDFYSIPDLDIPDKLNTNMKGKLSKRIAMVLDWGLDAYAHKDYRYVELALLIQFLRTCEGSDIELKGIITKPQNKQVKGTELTTKLLASNGFITWLELFANTWLEHQQGGLYQYKFGWDFKQYLITRWGSDPVEEAQSPFFTEPYSNEELNSILEYERSTKAAYPCLSSNGKLGRLAWKITTLLNPLELDMNKTKLYSFVYDAMLEGKCTGKQSITDEGFSGLIGKDKAQSVRNWLNAYNRDIEKFRKHLPK